MSTYKQIILFQFRYCFWISWVKEKASHNGNSTTHKHT